MAWYFVRGETGSDSNDGLNPFTAKKTFAGLVAAVTIASADVIWCAEKIRDNTTITGGATGGPAVLDLTGLSNVQIAQEPGWAQADIRCDRELVQTGWTASTNAWQLTLTGAPAATPNTVVYKWDASVTANGQHYGHLESDSLTDVQNAVGATGRFHFDTSTKVLSVYLGGANPNTSGFPVAVSWVPTSQEALIRITGGSGNSVRGLYFSLSAMPTAASQIGWGVILKSSPNSQCIDCIGRDMGLHTFGSYASGSSASGCIFSGCESWSGGKGGGGAFIAFTTSAFTMAAQFLGCEVHAYRYLGLDGNVLTGTLDAMAGDPFYAHADSGTPITDILCDGCLVEYLDNPGSGCRAFNAANAAAPSNGENWASYAMRVDRSFIRNSCMEYYTGNYVAFRRTKVVQNRTLDEGNNGVRGAFSMWTAAGSLWFESCEGIFDLTAAGGAAAQTRVFTVTQAAGLSFIGGINSSFWNVSDVAPTDSKAFCDYIFEDRKAFRFTGCVFGHKTTGVAPDLCMQDTSVSAANHGFVDCAYYNIGTGRFSYNSTLNTQAEWLSAVDTSARFLASTPFPNAPTDLSLTPASSLWTTTRSTNTVIPYRGINRAAYARQHGAYQYPLMRWRHGHRRGIGCRRSLL